MGDVYLARELAADRLVAMKFLRAGSGAAAAARFLVEVRALAGLDHPHIVRVLATDFTRPDPFFTMEYVPGGTLRDRIERGGPADPVVAARLLETVARAVHAAHSADVLHRDLKPSNILLSAGETPKVSDFGLAKRLDREDGLTVGPGELGTPAYMPPEQVSRRNGKVGPPSDVYGLGATLYHLLAGRAPFEGESRDEILARVLAEPPPRLRAIRPEVPAGLEGIVVKALEKDPQDRYPTAAGLADDLNRFLTGIPPEALPLTRARRAGRWVARHRARVAAASLALLLAVGLVAAGAAFGPPRGTGETPPAPDPAADIRAALADGREAPGLQPGGTPRYFRPLLAPAAPAATPDGQGCQFQAFGHGLLELFPDPGIDRYRVRFQLRHLDSRPPGAGERGFVGFYFGHAAAAVHDGSIAHVALAVTYADSDPDAVGQPRPPAPQPVYLRKLVYRQSPEADVFSQRTKAAHLNFTPRAALLPGTWRPVTIDVTPEAVRVQWRADDGQMVNLIHWSADQVATQYSNLRSAANSASPGAGAALPDWSPRRPMGLVAYKAAVAIRDLVIEPIP
jgi:serine/threonine-protein kinase